MRCQRSIIDFCKRDDGLSGAQYAVVMALTMAILLAAVTLMGKSASQTFQTPLPTSGAAVNTGKGKGG